MTMEAARRDIVIGALAALILCAAAAYTLWPTEGVEARAKGVVKACASSTYHPTCYEKKIPALMDAGVSMEDAFEITKRVQQLDPAFVYCHVLGHKISAKETAKDLTRWKDVIARSPLGLCSYGGIHGAFQERFRREWLMPDAYQSFVDEAYDACEPREAWQPTGVERASCMHAMGHLTMYVANGKVDDALSLCDSIMAKVGKTGSLPLCYDGVFMQVFQPLEPEDFALVDSFRPKTEEEAVAFCTAYGGAARSSCTSERWPYSKDALSESGQALASYCASAGDDERFCLMKMVNLVTALKAFSPEAMLGYCETLPEGSWQRESCIVNATSRMLENDIDHAESALLMCERASELKVKQACFEHLSSLIPYSMPHGAKRTALCTALPEPYNMSCNAAP